MSKYCIYKKSRLDFQPGFKLIFFNPHGAQGVEDGEKGHAHVCEDCNPHWSDTEQAEDKDDDFDP